MPSLWAQYIEELRAGKVRFIEHDRGFVSYSFPEWAQDCIMIDDIYVVPEFRKTGLGTRLLEEVCILGRAGGKKWVISQIDLTTPVALGSLQAQLAVGFLPVSANGDKLLMRRPIHG